MPSFQGLGNRAVAWRIIVVACLCALAIKMLFPHGQLALAIDSSPAALGSTQNAADREQVVVAGFAKSNLTPDAIRELDAMNIKLSNIPSVEQVRSAASVKTPATLNNDIRMAPLIERLRTVAGNTELEKQLLLQAVEESLLRGRYISKDGSAVAIYAELTGSHQERLNAAREIQQLVAAEKTPGLRWVVTGAPVVSGFVGDLILQQLAIVLPAAILIFTAVILLAFRSVVVVVATMTSIGVALLWTLAVTVALQWPLNLVTVIIPPLILTLAISYSMHVVSSHADRGSLASGLVTVRLPLALSALTSAIGLAALGFNSLFSVQQFAVLGAVGAVAAALSAWTVLPIFLAMRSTPPQLWPPLNSVLILAAKRIVNAVIDRSALILRLGVVAIVICAIGASLVEPGARYVRDLPAKQPVRQAYEEISTAFGGATRFYIDIRGATKDVMLDPNVMNTVDKLQSWLLDQEEIGGAISPLNFIKRLKQAFGSGDESDYTIPESASMAKQLVYIAAPEDIYRYANRSFSHMRIELTTPITDTPKLRALFDRIQTRLELLPAGLEAEIGGDAIALTEVIEKLTGGQLKSLAIAGLAIYLLLSLLFASFRVGAMAMLPNALPVLAYFALLGFTGTPLGPTTALVACIVLGIAVDDTLHLLVRFSQLARELANEEQASRAAVEEVLRPISLTTAATCLGFLTLVISPFHSQVMFGLLAAATLCIAWASDLLIAPAVSARSAIVTIWDHIRLDLGSEPQRTIPLMADMTERQARLLALNGSVKQLTRGENLVCQGETGKEMFVVLDGQFGVHQIDASGSSNELAVLTRGATIGEVGHFSSSRMATVTATNQSRVLVLDAEILERLRRRHTAVAALVYRNLNRIQAGRMKPAPVTNTAPQS